MATETLRSGVSITFDEYDLKDNNKIPVYQMMNPAVEFYLKDLAPSISKAVVVGAGVGIYSKILDEGGVETHNIEPNAERFGMLATNVPNGTNINKAISDTASTGTLKWFALAPSGAKLDTNNGSETASVDVVTLDSLNISDVDLLVIDVNGKEYEVLQGAATTILPNTKVIVHWNTHLSENLADLKSWIETQSRTKSLLHWESSDDSITKKSIPSTISYDQLDVVIDADILLE
jgi:FkbM family methyltransferase